MHGVRALLALGPVLGVGWACDWDWQLMPLLLGVIASALAETDDHWRGRLRLQCVALGVFSLVAGLVLATLAQPLGLAAALALCALALTMVGALGPRYQAIAFAALVFFLYVALSAPSGRHPPAQIVPWLFGGAIWHGAVSVLWAAWLARPPVRYRLAQVYALLGEYLQLKSRLLEPIRDTDREQRRMALALYNGLVVDALGAAKDALLCRLKGTRTPPGWLQQALHQYLSAQDIHERSSSSHEDYDTLAEAFFRSDAMYRCQRVLALQGEQCLKLSAAIVQRQPPQHQGATARAIEDLQGAIATIRATRLVDRPLRALQALGDNLTHQAAVLAQALQPAAPPTERALVDHDPASLAEGWRRVRAQCHLQSPLLRHALRLALALLAGFGLMQVTHDPHGWWIVLTITFVSQPHYAATLRRLGQRIGGTLLGLALGWGLVRLFPGELAQSALIAVSGAAFLGTRRTRYAVATGAITTLLLLSFHQLGLGEGVIAGRLLDTLTGSAIAGLAAWLVLPNWQARQWPGLVARSLRAQAGYLEEVLRQYEAGKQDHLAYRIARRDAHAADAALANSLAAMLKEPAGVRLDTDRCGRVLVLSHRLLNYLSALGAHRGDQGARHLDAASVETARALAQALRRVAEGLIAGRAAEAGALVPDSVDRMPEADLPRLVRAQLGLAIDVLRELAPLAAEACRRR